MSVGKHYDICCRVAKFIHEKPWSGIKYTTVELITQGASHPDVWATNGFESYQIEVKVSYTDFLKDKRKFSRSNDKFECGNYRYYCAPKGMIKLEELPEKWGLIEFDDSYNFEYTKESEYQMVNNRSELSILCSIMRREKIKPQIFNYRK